MGHHHHHGHDSHHHHHHKKSGRSLLLAFVLNFSFAIIEVIGGFYTNSMAILSDALHDFGDSTGLLMAFFLERLSHKSPDDRYTYGYRRFSVLSALINSFILFAGSLFVISKSIERIMTPEPIKPEGTILLAFLGIGVNAFAAYRLSKEEGLNHNAVMLHLMEDILGWVAVLIVGCVLLFKPWYILDPILSVLISLIVLRGVYKNIKKVGLIFLQRFPEHLKTQDITEQLQGFKGVCGIHLVQGWSIDETNYALTLHISVSPEMTVRQLDELKFKIKQKLEMLGVKNSTLEFESSDFSCAEVE